MRPWQNNVRQVPRNTAAGTACVFQSPLQNRRLKRRSQADTAVFGRAHADLDSPESNPTVTTVRICRSGATTAMMAEPSGPPMPDDTIAMVDGTQSVIAVP